MDTQDGPLKLVRAVRASVLVGALAAAGPASAAIVEYKQEVGRAAWEADVGSWETMDFTGFPIGTPISTQYEQDFGVVFTDGMNFVGGPSGLFPEDEWGLLAGTFGSTIDFEFQTPVRALSILFPGVVGVTLWLGDELVAETGLGQAGIGNFFGVVSDQPFDRVQLDDGADTFSIDDIRFGMVVPGPGVAAVWVVLVGWGSRRRRG